MTDLVSREGRLELGVEYACGSALQARVGNRRLARAVIGRIRRFAAIVADGHVATAPEKHLHKLAHILNLAAFFCKSFAILTCLCAHY